MDTKLFVVLAIIMATMGCEGKAALRRKPKVYNALITTDDDLVQSQAFPVIQPTIHETGIAHYPYGPYNPYGGFYNPQLVRFGQPLAPSLAPKQQLPYPLPAGRFPPQIMGQPLGPQPQPFPGYPLPQNPPTAPAAEKPQEASVLPTGLAEQPQPTVQPPTMMMPADPPTPLDKDPSEPKKMASQQLPIPLNQYGFPPSLIPLRQQYRPQPPPQPQPYGHLPPYAFNQFPPLYYNSLPGPRQPYLPHYNYLPTGPQFPLSNTIPTDKIYPQPPVVQPQPPSPPPPSPPPQTTPSPPALPEQPTETTALPPTQATEPAPSFEAIKNGSKSKDSDVPDVPPPPIPSGAKSKQS